MSFLGLARAGLLVLCALVSVSHGSDRSFVEDAGASNVALLVGVSHGLPGIDIDVDNLEAISTHSAYGFEPTILEEAAGNRNNVTRHLTRLAEAAGTGGTLFFYYTGHGSPGSLYLQDGSLKIENIRKAMEAGRAGLGPMERLVFVSDSCFSGSLMDPLHTFLAGFRDPRILSTLAADEILYGLSGDGRAPYWKRLFVFASSRADETSLAGKDGSVFTNAFVKAFKEAEARDGNMEDFVKLTQAYTKGHHPVARFAPETLKAEPLVP